MNVPDENILVIKRRLFDELGAFQGLNFEPRKYLDAILSRGNNFFLPRAQAEKDPSHKQIIPYALLTHGDKVLHYVRGKRAGEQRLVAKGSIGNRGGVEREVAEEIAIKTKFEDRIVALLNDDSTEVGQVHLGVVHVFKLSEPKVEKREAMITSLAFVDKNELLARRDSLETWSQICLDSLERLLDRDGSPEPPAKASPARTD